jgi:hypothetical protein
MVTSAAVVGVTKVDLLQAWNYQIRQSLVMIVRLRVSDSSATLPSLLRFITITQQNDIDLFLD